MNIQRWSEDAKDRLVAYWCQGLPAAEIGRRLGVTKNSVIGQAHRLGLEKRPSPIRRARPSYRGSAA